jgi:multiple sugar transport system substrate-binding protein
MKMSKLQTLGIAAVAASSLLLSACSAETETPDATEPVTITWSTWGSPEELTRFNEFNEQFMADNPDIKVEFQAVADYGEYHSKLLAQLVSGTAPDVFYLGDDKIGQFVDAGVLLGLSELMDSEASLTKVSDFEPGILAAASKDGEIYAAPNDVNPDALWYDKEVLAAAGITEDPAALYASGAWTTDKFFEMTDAIEAEGLFGLTTWHYWATHWSWITSQGGTVYDASGNFVAHQDPTSVAALDQWTKKFNSREEFILSDDQPEGDSASNKFVTHKVGFYPSGRYRIGTVTEAGVQDSYDIVPWPTPSGTQGSTGVAASFLGINVNTAVKDAAFRFWTAFLSVEGQTFRLADGGNAVPSIKGADADAIVTAGGYPANAKVFLEMRDLGYSNFPLEATVPGLGDSINAEIRKAYDGEQDAQTALNNIAALVEAAKNS